MACYHPLIAYRSREKSKNGKYGLSFSIKNGYYDLKVQVPCGQCIGCRLEKSRQWAIRCVHEAQMHEENCFITLTYNKESLPADGSLRKRDFQLFMKRLRKECGEGIRYYMCGEYGAKYERPHYHICLFGYDFKDKYIWDERDKVPLYRSTKLEKLWTLGFSTIGEVTFQSAAYVAPYRDWETDRKSTRLNSSHSAKSRMPSSA